MAKTLIDSSHGGHWNGPTVKLTPTDKTGTPEQFEKLYDRRQTRRVQRPEPQPKLRPIENQNMSELLE